MENLAIGLRVLDIFIVMAMPNQELPNTEIRDGKASSRDEQTFTILEGGGWLLTDFC